VLPPGGEGKFGYSESYPPKAGGAGVLAEVNGFHWQFESTDNLAADQKMPTQEGRAGPVLLIAKPLRRFRILNVRKDEVESGKPPLYVASVQLLAEHDTMRGSGKEALEYWTQKAGNVKEGTAIIAKQPAIVFESVDSHRVVAEMPTGVTVIAAGPPVVVEGYMMVPIAPTGAVELTLFRERIASGTLALPTEDDLTSTLLNLGKDPQSAPQPWHSRGRRKRNNRSGFLPVYRHSEGRDNK